MQPLHVVAAVFNPLRFRSRAAAYKVFEKHVQDAGAILHTVDVAFGERPHAVTTSESGHLQLRTWEELWLKEAAWNVGIAHLPASAEYVATIDADMMFVRPDWAEETVHQLQHYRCVQMFSEVSYLDPNHTPLFTAPSFAAVHLATGGKPGPKGSYAKMVRDAAPGGAWAFRREDLARVGGLIDYGILGSSDSYMAQGLVGTAQDIFTGRNFHPEYVRPTLEWQRRADRWLRRDVGCVPGVAMHYWHGKLSQRGYGTRDRILIDYQFNPTTDLTKDEQGLWQLDDDGSRRHADIRDAIRAYFRARNEDSIDVK
jgi:hypothetical protein